MTIDQILVTGAIIGGLAGALAFMFRALVASKNQRINELIDERDYWRGLVGIEARIANPEQHPLPLVPATALAVPESRREWEVEDEPADMSRFAYWMLFIQAGISILVLILSFWLIYQPTEAIVNQTAGNLIVFVIGVWLGRGVD